MDISEKFRMGDNGSGKNIMAGLHINVMRFYSAIHIKHWT